MNALSEEQNEVIFEYAADAVIPVSVFEGMILHHEEFALKEMKEVIEGVGGKVSGEGHHV